jgi:hypothetical protein
MQQANVSLEEEELHVIKTDAVYRRHISLNITETQSMSTDQPTNRPINQLTKLMQQSSAEEPDSVLLQLVKNSLAFMGPKS